jgi:Mg-chelatase subunit ChlD
VHIAFDRPAWLVLLALLVPVVWLGWRSIAHLGRARSVGATVARALVVILLAAGLSRPSIVRSGEGVSVIVVADASRSVPSALRQQVQAWLRQRVEARTTPTDRVGVVTVARTPEIVSVPSAVVPVDTLRHGGDPVGSDLAAGVRTALAMLPPDTAHRIVLVSDGVETSGNLAEAAERAAVLGVPIDVVPVVRPSVADVMVEALRTPARARRGQVIDARVVLRSSSATSGRLRLRMDGRFVDLDPRGSSDALALRLEPGPNAISIPLPMDRSGAVRLEAVFEADQPAADSVGENNLGASITLVAGDGRVLLVGEGPALVPIVQAIEAANLEAEVVLPDGLASRVAGGDLDACVLVDVPRWALDAETDRALAASVHDLGCGLVMIGGVRSFGAGGWNESAVAGALPVDMVPPQERKLPTGALALVIDCSGSMMTPVAGAGGSSQMQIAIEAAIKAVGALTPKDEVTVIAFAGEHTTVVPLTRCENRAGIESSLRSIQAAGGTNMFPALEEARKELAKSRSATRHVVALTDGATSGNAADGFAIAAAMQKDGITLSTVAIGDGSNDGLLARLANIANGRFYAVTDTQSRVSIPQIFIKEAQLVRRSMVWEGEPFVPARVASAEWTRGLDAMPPIGGYVITGARGEPAQLGLVSQSDLPDPILAWWNHGLGRAVALTTDLGGTWTPDWVRWPGYQPFVAGMMRWVMRPGSPPDLSVRTRVEGDEAVVEVEATGEVVRKAQSAEARVVEPEGSSRSLMLRQVAPGRWNGRFAVDRAGAYLVNAAVSMAAGERPMFTQAVVSVPYPREFRTAESDLARLEGIAQRTGGRVIRIGDTDADLFLDEGLPVPETVRQAWDLCVYLAAILFIIDVAVRRLSLEWNARPKAELVRDTARVTAAWRHARASARGEVPFAAPHAAGDGGAAAGESRDVASAAVAESTASPTRPAMPEAEEPEDESPMGRLRAAKRRARGGSS